MRLATSLLLLLLAACEFSHGSLAVAADGALPASCNELHVAQPVLGDAVYTIDPDGPGGAAAVATFCDMTTDGGGWTLVGKVDGRFDMYGDWLIGTVDAAALRDPMIGSGSYACIDAVALAVEHSTEIRFSNSTCTRWVKWPLPAGRAIATFWHHSVGYTTINAAAQVAVTATGWDGTTSTCYQNALGVMNWDTHGGAYPAAARNTSGNTIGSDLCMAIGTQTQGTVDGFTSNGNQFDAPLDETSWPNDSYNVTPHIAVWLR